MEKKQRKIKNYKKADKYGFSFIEVLISVFLISVGLMAAVFLLSSNIMHLLNSRNQVIAGLLAQEGVELVINTRDTQIKNGGDESFDGFSTAEDCVVDIDATTLSCGSTPEQEKLYRKEYYYVHDSSGENSKFKRKIDILIENSGSDDEIMTITSFVIWGEDFPDSVSDLEDCNLGNKCAFTQTTLSKWRESD